MRSADGHTYFEIVSSDSEHVHAHLGWYQVTIIFFVWSIVGLLLEETWMHVSLGVDQSRVGLVWGPFSPMYGTGAVLLTAVLYHLRRNNASPLRVFVASALVGGLLEQATGWCLETFFHVVSWDYVAGGIPGALTQWVAIPFLVVWGTLGCLWDRLAMPRIMRLLEAPTTRLGETFVAFIAMFLLVDILMTLVCFDRMMERDAQIPPSNALEEFVDVQYDDEFVMQRFQNMEIHGEGGVQAAVEAHA